jgi:hypothetical protein
MFTELGVHFSAISEKLPYMVFRRMPNQKFWHFSAYLSDKIEKSPSPIPKMFSSRPSVTRHLNIRSKHYSNQAFHTCRFDFRQYPPKNWGSIQSFFPPSLDQYTGPRSLAYPWSNLTQKIDISKKKSQSVLESTWDDSEVDPMTWLVIDMTRDQVDLGDPSRKSRQHEFENRINNESAFGSSWQPGSGSGCGIGNPATTSPTSIDNDR